VRAVESAVGVKIPDNARIIRNLLMGAQFQQDHIVHFYHLHALDWVDVVNALKADPKKTAALADNVSNAPWGGVAYYKQVAQRLQAFVDSGQLGPFTNGYWGHPAYKLPPEANLMAAAHYIEALRLQAKSMRMHAIFGAKNPHLQALAVGGVTCVKDLTPDRIAEFLFTWKETQDFIEKVYIPDLLAVASFYKDWGAIGGTSNFHAWGEFPQNDKEPESLLMPRGVIIKRNYRWPSSKMLASTWPAPGTRVIRIDTPSRVKPSRSMATTSQTADTPGSRHPGIMARLAKWAPWLAFSWPMPAETRLLRSW